MSTMRWINFHKGILFAVLTVFVLSAIGIGYWSQKNEENPLQREVVQNWSLDKRFRINEFSLVWNQDGRKLLSIQAGQVAVEKEKFGFFRLGYANRAVFKNAQVAIYGNVDIVDNSGRTRGEHKYIDVAALESALTKENMGSIPVKNISSVVVEPVCVKLYSNDSLVTEICADHATLNPAQKDLLFQGNVKVESSDRTLTAGRLAVKADQATFEADEYFILRTPEGIRQGKQLFTDLLLNTQWEASGVSSAGFR